jgi:membrane associated rhomboid family serine protease
MLEDRDYMRQPEFRDRRVSLTVALLIANAVVFLVECLLSPQPGDLTPANPFFYKYFALSVQGLQHFYVWQLLTYQFMHAKLWHILINSWVIYVFGRELEEILGWKKFLALYLSSGVIGGIFQVLAALAWPEHFGGAVVGASACGFGLVAAFAALFPDRELTMLLFFIIPIRLLAKTLLILSAVLAVAGIVFPSGNIANAAHLGGMAMGFFFVRQIIQGRWWQWRFPVRRAAPREFVTARAGKGKFWRSAANPTTEELSAEEFLQREVDPILDKISAHGIQSLTPHERDVLEKARAKMAKR